MCNVAQILTVVLLVNAMIGVSDAFFVAKMFGPSAELEAACPGTCQVRFKQKHLSGLGSFFSDTYNKCNNLILIFSFKFRHFSS